MDDDAAAGSALCDPAADDMADQVTRRTHRGGAWEGEFRAVRKDGSALVVWGELEPRG